MQIEATDDEQVVYSKDIRYRKGSTNSREYDFCHYLLSKNATAMTTEKLD